MYCKCDVLMSSTNKEYNACISKLYNSARNVESLKLKWNTVYIYVSGVDKYLRHVRYYWETGCISVISMSINKARRTYSLGTTACALVHYSSKFCLMCDQAEKSRDHILVHRHLAHGFWFSLARHSANNARHQSKYPRPLACRLCEMKGFNSLALGRGFWALVAWHLWKPRSNKLIREWYLVKGYLNSNYIYLFP